LASGVPFPNEKDIMQSIENAVDRDYGARVLAALLKRGLVTTQPEGTLKAIEKASRLARPFKWNRNWTDARPNW
jgi:hypothetical protein